MALDSAYLDYPKRRHGMDHEFYPWSSMSERPPIAWPNGKRVAVWIMVNLEWFPIVPRDKPFRAPGHMQTSYPDYRHYTAREYGTRVGFYRLLDAFAKIGARVSVAVNGAIADRYPSIIADIVAAGHEIVAHSTDMNGTIASGIDPDEERALILRALASLEKASGIRPRGWHSIARSQSFATPGLLVEAGLDYMCDWVNDELPYRFATPAGEIVNLPLNHELSDRQILVAQQHSVDSYAEQMIDAYDLLERESATFGGRMLPLNVTPYIMGLPYRIDAFEALLATLAARPGTWFARGDEIVDAAMPAI
ncbi:polysaccharide deacetylase family protein [Sphingomonas sp. QA11]|uniref:polysaccharide deacetylase family protein n=1 Tax=Sphingomonas sp. QA11 TaxID=2950605 RepID=UPI0023498BB4|nr:polysaccharide deacetylase family protein [Sphingomonas sp. QA11]WCM28800.1 polysaccharide deacetylase family protein [Sphingomonas sp. QA11]